jgi:hypothetical protein
MRDGPGGKAEIGFGFAATGREEEQIDGLTIDVQRIVKSRKIEKDEGQLERSPLGRILGGGIAAVARGALAIGARYGLVHGAEGKPRVRIAREQRDAFGNASACIACRIDEVLSDRLSSRLLKKSLCELVGL